MGKKTIILLVILICSCWGWDSVDFGSGFFYLNRSIFKTIKQEGKYDSSILLIPREVLNYSYDNRFIIAYQIPVYDIARESVRENLPKEKQDSLDRQKESMSAIQDCYWIIRKSDSRIWGPMTASDFKTMCLRLKIKAKLSKKKEKKRLL